VGGPAFAHIRCSKSKEPLLSRQPGISGTVRVIMAAHSNGQAFIFLPVVSSSSIYLFSSLNLSDRRLNVYHTSTHGVALVRI